MRIEVGVINRREIEVRILKRRYLFRLSASIDDVTSLRRCPKELFKGSRLFRN
jgi:hypothetical protein